MLPVLLAVLLALGTLAGAAAAGPRDKDEEERGGRRGDEPDQAEVVEDAPAAEGTVAYVDSDGDQLPDIIDNCPGAFNFDQVDEDDDGVGDACDPPPDDDGDGVPNRRDNCVGVPNPNQTDGDGDGIGNQCDDPDDGEEGADGSDGAGDETAAEEEGEQSDDVDADEADEADDGASEADEADEAGEPDEEVARSEAAAPRAGEGDLPISGAVPVAPEGPPPALEPEGPPPALEPEGPPPVLEPFVVPPPTFEVVARIDAGALPPDEDEPAGSIDEPEGSTDEPAEADSFLEQEEALLGGDATSSGEETDATVDEVGDEESLGGVTVSIAADVDPEFAVEEAAETSDGEVVDDALDHPWAFDDYFTGGLARSRPQVTEIAGTDEDEVYLTQRRGDADGRPGEFSYAIPVPEAGTYQVRLHFAEIYWGATGGAKGGAGRRVFSVDAEGEATLVDYDIYADVGPMRAVVKEVEVEVEDGTLDLRFYGTRDQPMVAAIEVLAEPTGEP